MRWLVPYFGRVDVLIGIRPLGDAVHVVPGFMAEGAGPDIRGERVRRHVGEFADVMGDVGEQSQLLVADAINTHLKF